MFLRLYFNKEVGIVKKCGAFKRESLYEVVFKNAFCYIVYDVSEHIQGFYISV